MKTDKPASEGIVALLEPFTDTVVVCTMTAMVLIVTGAWKVDGIVKSDSAELYSMPLAGAAVVQQVDKGDELRILGSSEDKDSGQTFGKVWQDGAETDSMG